MFEGLGNAYDTMMILAIIGFFGTIGGLVYLVYWLVKHVSFV